MEVLIIIAAIGFAIWFLKDHIDSKKQSYKQRVTYEQDGVSVTHEVETEGKGSIDFANSQPRSAINIPPRQQPSNADIEAKISAEVERRVRLETSRHVNTIEHSPLRESREPARSYNKPNHDSRYKVCSGCGKRRKKSSFFKSSKRSDGLTKWCKFCHQGSKKRN